MTRDHDSEPPGDALRTPFAVRAFTERTPSARNEKRKRRRAPGARRSSRPAGWSESVLIFDTETTVDASQRLTFGTYRYCRWNGTVLDCVEEGLFYADELAAEDPSGFATLKAYATTERLKLMPRREFIERVFFPAACEARAIVIGFNLPFDLSRIAVECGEGRGRYYGGFSFSLANYWDDRRGVWRDDTYYARVCVKHVDSKRAFIGFTGGREPRKGQGFSGRFLDLKTLAFALTNQGYSLARACEAFGVEHGKTQVDEHGRISPEYIAYNRRDVQASQELLEKLRAEFDRHPIALDPCRAYSSASIAKAYLAALGVNHPRQQFSSIPKRVYGIGMSAYFGGRAEVRIRNTPVPVVYTDFLSMYPTVNSLLGLWDLLTAERIEIVEATAEIQDFLQSSRAESCFRRETWTKLLLFAQIQSSEDILPARAQYAADSDAWNIGVNRLTSEKALWFAGPDLVASAVLTGKAPTVVRAFRLVPHGRQQTLQPLKLGGEILIDPRTQDFFRMVVEQRKALRTRAGLSGEDRKRLDQFLKVLANSGSYGVFAQMIPEDLRKDEMAEITVHGIAEPFSCETNAPESAGPFCFPPIAALIPSAARLQLALLERCVSEAGGNYAMCDTDSMAIVATRDGGLVRCDGGPLRTAAGEPAIRGLSWSDVRRIVERFEQLSPYDRSIIPGSILKIEDVNYSTDGAQRQLHFFGISAKRYALFERAEDGTVNILKPSEHGLGHLLNPVNPGSEGTDWIAQTWHRLIDPRESTPEFLWLDRPAISRLTISAPALLRPLSNDQRKYRDRVKPFNFALSAHVAPFGHPVGTDPSRFHLVAPYERDASKWARLSWRDAYSQQAFDIATGVDAPSGTVRVKSFRDVIGYYAAHPEPKSATANGMASNRTTKGLLSRRHVIATGITYLGKESNRIEEVEQGLVHSWDEIQGAYSDPEEELREVLLPVLQRMPRKDAAKSLGISERSVSSIRSGAARPSKRTAEGLRQLAALARLMSGRMTGA